MNKPKIKIKLRNRTNILVLLAILISTLASSQLAMAESKLIIAILPVEYVGMSEADGRFIEKVVFQSFTESHAFIVKSRGEYDRAINEVMKENEQCKDGDECYVQAAEGLGARRIVQVDLTLEKGNVFASAQVVNLKKEVLVTYAGMCSAEPLHENVRVEIEKMVAYLIKHSVGEGGQKVREPRSGTEYGSLSITTKPAGATVYLNGENKGKSPLKIEGLPIGELVLTLQYEGYSPVTKMVTIDGGDLKVDEKLAPMAGTLEVTSNPPSAEVLVDGRYGGETGKKPLMIPGLPVGRCELVLRLRKYEDYSVPVTIKFNQTTKLHAVMVGSVGKVQILTNLDGLVVESDGENQGTTKSGIPFFFSAEPGQHEISLRRNGGKILSSRILEVPAGGVVTYDALDLVQELEPGEVWSDGLVNMVAIPTGSFLMGSPESDSGRDSDEVLHKVEISRSFLIGQYEVTQGQWKEIMGTNPSYFQNCGSDCPVETVSWYGAVMFCNRLSEKESLEKCYEVEECQGTLGSGCGRGIWWCDGDYKCVEVRFKGLGCKGYRLPTESEWEYMSRAGRSNPGDLNKVAWYSDNSGSSTHPVGQKQANYWNVYDSLGNVWEWTWDYYDSYSGDGTTDPTGSSTGSFRGVRGGGWGYPTLDCRSANRDSGAAVSRSASIGFRLSKSL